MHDVTLKGPRCQWDNFVDDVVVRVQPCEVVEVSMEPSKLCEVFEVLFEILRTSSRENPELIYKQNEVRIQRRT